MKFMLALFAILAITGLSQAHKVPDFGKGPLHEDIQDILDLIPMQEIADVFLDYLNDDEVKAAGKFLESSQVLTHLMNDTEAIPEVRNLFNFLQEEGIEIYNLINMINKALGIKKLEPPPTAYAYSMSMQRTGGIAGFFKDVKKLIKYDDFIRIYVHKMKTSPAFVRFINQLKSDNFQQIVNKVYSTKPFQIILNGLKISGVDVQIVWDIMYIVLGITVPDQPERSVEEELIDFLLLLPQQEFYGTMLYYLAYDSKVQHVVEYIKTPEYHTLLRNLEALKEYQALIVYLQKTGLDIIKAIKEMHKLIGMEDYVPPKIEDTHKFQIGVHRIGDGFKGMYEDLTALIPEDKVQALYKKKLQTSKVFADFVAKMKSPELQRLGLALYYKKAFRIYIAKSEQEGIDFQAIVKFYEKLLPIS